MFSGTCPGICETRGRKGAAGCVRTHSRCVGEVGRRLSGEGVGNTLHDSRHPGHVQGRECNDDGAQNRPARIGDEDLKSLELRIEGMHCSGCAHDIESLLGRDPGMKSASVSHATVTRLPFWDRSHRRYRTCGIAPQLESPSEPDAMRMQYAPLCASVVSYGHFSLLSGNVN